MKQRSKPAAVQWLFGCEHGNWTWRSCAHDGSVLARSQETFGSLMDAIADAHRHGFNAVTLTHGARL